MKILYFHQHFTTPTQAGGTRSYELAQRLIAKGIRSVWFAVKRQS